MNNQNLFYTYLLGKISEDSAKSYLSYLRNCDSKKLSSLPPGDSLLSIIEAKCENVSSDNEKFDIIQKYISEISKIITSLDSTQFKLRKDLSNVRSALRSFSDYVTLKEPDIFDGQKSQSKKGKFQIRDVEQIDGMAMLTDKFSDTREFVQFVLSGCYFFSTQDMHNQYVEMTNNINNGTPIPTRYSENRKLFNKKIKRGSKGVIFNDRKSSGDIWVDIDGNGNAAIDKLFTYKTGRYLKGAKNRQSDFINLKISHIWGNAFDPRYFISMWNIVFVPSFANDILDKPSSEKGSYHLGACLLNTIKAILYKLYGLSSLDWSKLRLTPPSYISDKVIKGKYTIQVFDYSNDLNEGIPEIQPVDLVI